MRQFATQSKPRARQPQRKPIASPRIARRGLFFRAPKTPRRRPTEGLRRCRRQHLEQLRCSRQAPLEARCRQVPFRERSGAVVEPDREEELKLKAVGEMV